MKPPAYTRLGGRLKARDGDWAVWASNRPTLATGLWLIDWRALGLPHYCIYVIAPDGQWPVKVGISCDPRSRLQALQGANWKRLEVAKCFWVDSIATARAVEAEVHRDYSARKKWLLGEWVDGRPDEAGDLIGFTALRLGIELNQHVPEEGKIWVEDEINRLWPIKHQIFADIKATEARIALPVSKAYISPE